MLSEMKNQFRHCDCTQNLLQGTEMAVFAKMFVLFSTLSGIGFLVTVF